MKKKTPLLVGYLVDATNHIDWVAKTFEGDTVEEVMNILPDASSSHSHAIMLNTKTWEMSDVIALR